MNNNNIELAKDDIRFIKECLIYYLVNEQQFVSYTKHVKTMKKIKNIMKKLVKTKKRSSLDEIIAKLDKFKKEYPDTEIILETTNGTASCKIKDANIYERMIGKLVIDLE